MRKVFLAITVDLRWILRRTAIYNSMGVRSVLTLTLTLTLAPTVTTSSISNQSDAVASNTGIIFMLSDEIVFICEFKMCSKQVVESFKITFRFRFSKLLIADFLY